MIKGIFHITCDKCNKALKESNSLYSAESEAYHAAQKKGWHFTWIQGRGEHHYCPTCKEKYTPAELQR